MNPWLDVQVTLEDLVAFQQYALEHRQWGRRNLAKYRFWRTANVLVANLIGCALWVWLFGFSYLTLAAFVIVYAGIAAGVWFLAPGDIVTRYRRSARKALPTGAQPWCRIWLDSEGLTQDGASYCTRYPWNAIEEISETPLHAFVWVAPERAIVIPRRVGDLQFRFFLEALRTSVMLARAGATSSDPRGWGLGHSSP